jgi:hypothetical protein
MKKKYTRPSVFKVRLNPEQAVLGTCQAGAISIWKGVVGGDCAVHHDCRQDRAGHGDSSATS